MNKIELTFIDEVVTEGELTYYTGRQLIIGPNDTPIHASIDPEDFLDSTRSDV
jgi:hypothetical protein